MKHPEEIAKYSGLFKLLGNDKRLCILINLCIHGERTVSDLADCANGSQSYISQQLGKLRDLNIVATRKDGLQIYYKLVNEDIKKIICHSKLNNICDKKR